MNTIVSLPLVGIPVAAAPVDPDAEFVALAERIKSLHPKIAAASQALKEAGERYEALKPEKPQTLKWRPFDADFVHRYSNTSYCTDESIDALRGKEFATWQFTGTEAELEQLNPSYLGLSVLPVAGHEHLFVSEPDGRKCRRAAELIESLDRYRAANAIAIEQSGCTPLEHALEELLIERDEITEQMLELKPQSVRGLQALAIGLLYAEWQGDIERRPSESLEDELLNMMIRALTQDRIAA
ncbi:hypothetical protein [Bradyrhizobium sp.]|uniref:hypothetical protein n=1 Tax=Bradyrhizobium sp. TaxID=376 RepID=UPI0039E2E023